MQICRNCGEKNMLKNTMESYQYRTGHTAVYPRSTKEEAISYLLLGLGGEVGELQNIFKKILRGDEEFSRDKFLSNVRSELGDVLWYLARLCAELGIPLEQVAEANILKLAGRKYTQRVAGSGDRGITWKEQLIGAVEMIMEENGMVFADFGFDSAVTCPADLNQSQLEELITEIE